MNKYGILFVVEKGDLEQKVVLLVESLRKFSGLPGDLSLVAIKPTKGSLSEMTIDIFQKHHVFYIE